MHSQVFSSDSKATGDSSQSISQYGYKALIQLADVKKQLKEEKKARVQLKVRNAVTRSPSWTEADPTNYVPSTM